MELGFIHGSLPLVVPDLDAEPGPDLGGGLGA
jgi:hypothetical protein